jgi:uncharacterized membrane protein
VELLNIERYPTMELTPTQSEPSQSEPSQSGPRATRQSLRLLTAAGVILGMGFAGFFDGIVIHQVLQWHHMVTTIQPATSLSNLEVNTFWDGVFHVGTFALTIAGLILLWRAIQREGVPTSAQPLIGAVLIGAGSFNVIEGVIDHHLLAIHHVKSGVNQLAWDLGFLVVSVMLAIAGWVVLVRYQQTNYQQKEQ